MKNMIFITMLFVTLSSVSFAAERTRSFECQATEGRIKAAIKFVVRLNADGSIREDGNQMWHNIQHMPLKDSTGQNTPSLVYVNNAQRLNSDEKTLRLFWNLKGAAGQLVTRDTASEKDAAPGDMYFYGASNADMNQSELVVFSKSNYRAGEFRFKVDGDLQYRTQVVCR